MLLNVMNGRRRLAPHSFASGIEQVAGDWLASDFFEGKIAIHYDKFSGSRAACVSFVFTIISVIFFGEQNF